MDIQLKMSNENSCDNTQFEFNSCNEDANADKLNIIINKNENFKQLKKEVPVKSESIIKSGNYNNDNKKEEDCYQLEVSAIVKMEGQYHATASTSREKEINQKLRRRTYDGVNYDDNKMKVDLEIEMAIENDNIKGDDVSSEMDDKTQSSVISSPERDSIPSDVLPINNNSSVREKIPISSIGDNISKLNDKTAHEKSVEDMLNLTSNNYITVQPINVIRNGTIPNAGKPQLSTMSKKLEQSTKSGRTRKPKSTVAMYESELSKHKPGIKLCIKKSDTTFNTAAATATAVSAVVKAINKSVTLASSKSRKGSRQVKQRARLYDNIVELDKMVYEPKRKKERGNKKSTAGTSSGNAGLSTEETNEPIEQSVWGSRLPEDVLLKVFEMLVEKEGSLPILCRLGRVCSLWRRVSLRPALWKIMDLTTWTKEKYRSELKLKWFVDNRCKGCTELNVSNWKVSDINCFLHKLVDGAPNLVSITLAGWKGFTSDHLAFLVDKMKKLQKLDLSSINVEMNASKSAVGVQSLCSALQAMNERLTHLYLAQNRLAGIPQMINMLTNYCPNLLLLDLSNVSTQATSHGVLHIEKLQQGCPKLKVLRITNSHITLTQEMLESPGFPDLEELSVAALNDESRLLGDEILQRILKSSSKLKLLDVRCCTRLTHESFIRLPAWDIKYLFLSGCSVTRDMGSGLELIASKWAHSLIELDLAWANVQQPLDNALHALADKGAESRLAHLNLCGSSVSEEAVKEILANCPLMSSINLSSCRGLPRGIKRLMQGPQELNELREVLKVQLKVKLPESTNVNTSTLQSTTVASLNNANNSNENAGGGGIHCNNSP